ncbi:hypothetical protein DCO58_11500 [Helicobacter saguini]|uniref:Ferrochelatase n=1 Tax=Helicobacter saguini TaxID=1548018 RepID=A0A347VQ44_9HELI|nr:hypothetical protein [Helicobacter saguini]MWV61086.1 hypothetical protein [Helicobacter saguini]MWV68245.1 hypothetical protein [Helicobacter saguini]MWV70291.1 hypothetical protein [Helicobacter saguini]MWV72193.1 hypothetical protein [Helicobacter saguini]TLD95247.1 hypothetical protein LS64_002480 [Helicobacter saguini]
MRLEKILDILYGTLVNKGYISTFSSLANSADETKKGSLFFSFNNDDIGAAIKNGAYGVVFSGECEISDSEIAWIKVDSMEKSIFRLIRYLILESNYIFLMMNTLEIDSITKIMHDEKAIKILKNDDLNETLNYLFSNYLDESKGVDSKKEIIISDIKELEKIEVLKICSLLYTQEMQARNYDFSNNEFIKVIDKNAKLNIFSYNLFETKIHLNEKIFTLNYPYIFTPFLQGAINSISYINENFSANITYNVRENIKYFECAFLDSKLRFSNTQRQKALIFLPNIKIFSLISLKREDFSLSLQSEIKKIIKENTESKFLNIIMTYFKIHISHQKVLICYKNGSSLKKPFAKCSILPYPHIANLKQILSNIPFDIAIICGSNKTQIDLTPKPKNPTQPSLFG